MVKTILMIKSDYLKFLKKKEVVGRPIVDKTKLAAIVKLTKYFV